ncbi:MAG TPA: tetratricopeptide repeat protein [Ignavibacteria bacterium]|nr:tetratricopeptide repeat protein [Ignavibacteria bacterium]
MIKRVAIFFILTLGLIALPGCSNKQKQINSKKTAVVKKNISAFTLADSLMKDAKYDSSNTVLFHQLEGFLADSSYSLYVEALNKITGNYYDIGDYGSAASYCEKALHFAKEHLDSINLETSQTYFALGTLKTDERKFEEAKNYCTKSLNMRKTLLPENDPLIGDNYNLFGNIEFYQHHPQKALAYYEKALVLRKRRGFYNKSVALTYMNLGNIYNDLYQFESSISYFDTASMIQKKVSGKNHPVLAIIAINKSSSFDKIGELDSAIISLKKALDILKLNFGKEHPYMGIIYNNLAILYGSYGDSKKAIEYIRKSIDIKEKFGVKFTNQLIDNYAALGNTYRDLKQYAKSIIEFEKALELIKGIGKPDRVISSNIKKILAVSYLYVGNKSKAYKIGKEAIEELKFSDEYDKFMEIKSKIFFSEILTNIKRYDESIVNSIECIDYLSGTKYTDWLVYSYEKLAEAYFESGDYLSVINVYEKVKTIFPPTKKTEIVNMDKINQIRGVNGLFSDILGYSGQSYLKLYEISSDKKNLVKANDIYDLLINLFTDNYSKVAFESSKFLETKKFRQHIIYGIKAAYENFKLQPNIENFENTLKFSEFSKSLTVLQNLSEKSALAMFDIPTEQITGMKNLRRKINFYLRKLSTENSEELPEADIKFYKEQLINADLEYEKMRDNLKNKFPLLKSLTEISLGIQLDSIRANLLDDDQTAIEYYIGENELYTFVISKNKFYIVKNNLPEDLESEIIKLLDGIENNQFDNFMTNSYSIYNTIFAEADNLINTKRVLIINDGILGYIPYDVLLYAQPEKNKSYKNLPYLIKKYSIGYAYSFNILGKSGKGDNIISKFLGIAPFSK